jgi:hypothetical protein
VRSDACSPRDLCLLSPLTPPGFSCPAKYICIGEEGFPPFINTAVVCNTDADACQQKEPRA